MLISEDLISHWRTKVLCYFHFQEFLQMEKELLLLQSISTLQDCDDSQYLSEITIKTDVVMKIEMWRHIELTFNMESFIHEENSCNKQEQIWEFGQVGTNSLFKTTRMQRVNLCSPKLGKIWLHKEQVFNLIEHCQASCSTCWTDHMINYAVNIAHWLTFLRRLRLPPGKIRDTFITYSY